MEFCLAASLSSYLHAWEIYKVRERALDMIITEEDYNKMLAVIRSQGLREEVSGEVHRWYGTREEILATVNAIELSTHGGPSFEEYDDSMFDEMLARSVDADSDELPYTVYEVEDPAADPYPAWEE